MRPEEEFVKNSVISYLGGHIEAVVGDDPPDYYFTVAGVRTAVEVTRLVEVSYGQDGSPKNRLTEDMYSVRMCDRLDAALGCHLQDGLDLLLVIFGPIKSPRIFKRNLYHKVSSVVHDPTVKVGWNQTYEIAGNEVRVFAVRRRFGSRVRITGCIENRDAVPFIEHNASGVLAHAISRKAARMSELSWTGPKWLCLLNDYWLADHETYERAHVRMGTHHEFERVFLVDYTGTVYTLGS